MGIIMEVFGILSKDIVEDCLSKKNAKLYKSSVVQYSIQVEN